MQDIADQVRSTKCVDPELFLPDEWQALDAAVRQQLLSHVAECPVCQAERGLAERFAEEFGRQPTVPLARSWPLALAAALALALGLGLWVGDRGAGIPALPDAPESGIVRGSGLTLDGYLHQDGSVFEWSAISNAVSYRLTATDLTGRVVWNQETAALRLTPDLDGASGTAAWRWYVEALGSDGRILATSAAIDASTLE